MNTASCQQRFVSCKETPKYEPRLRNRPHLKAKDKYKIELHVDCRHHNANGVTHLTTYCQIKQFHHTVFTNGHVTNQMLMENQSSNACSKIQLPDVRIRQYEVCKNDKKTLLEERKNLKIAMADQAYHLKLHKE